MKLIRQVPEGLCKQCEGTGVGEALADLGEARSHGRPLPVKSCKSCGGSGMAIAKAQVTALGRLLLFPIAAAMYRNSRPIAAAPEIAGPPTSELLALRDAIGSSTPTSVPESIKQSVR